MTEHKYTNELIHEKSPYLLQHSHNPVDWYPWGPEAFGRAVGEDKPIFLSIGYSTCHWCHVMERECFEDPEVAVSLNEHFISIKVDREERPDVDHIYMSVCQTLTGSGGWPLTIFMTPEREPFFAGTYFPKHDRMGMQGLMSILERVNAAWSRNRKSLMHSSKEILKAINEDNSNKSIELNEDTIHTAFSQFKNSFDNVYGGFGNAPKFPTPHNLYFLLRYYHSTKDKEALEMVEKTLNAMYSGGIYDHIGFGFSRYSTDRKWLVPHFEKMLYDNALLAIAYLETYQVTKNVKYTEVAKQIFTYLLRDMVSTEGGFFSAEDADSEGEEGKFYVWSYEEAIKLLGQEDGEKFAAYYHITPKGNFEGNNIPNIIGSDYMENNEFIAACRNKMFSSRENRIHPYKDDKILTSWNGLIIAALAIGGRILSSKEYISAAEKAVSFIYDNLLRADGRLLERYRDGEAAIPAYVDDYSFLIWGLIELYETTYKPDYLKKAVELNSDLLKYFWDNENAGLFIYGSDSEQLIARPKEVYDGATPSGNSVSALNFLRLARLTGMFELEDKASMLLNSFGQNIKNYPKAYTFSLIAFMFSQSKANEIVLAVDEESADTREMLDIINEEFRPFTISMVLSKDKKDLERYAPFIATYSTDKGKTTAYICENFSCQAPVTKVEVFREMLRN